MKHATFFLKAAFIPAILERYEKTERIGTEPTDQITASHNDVPA